MCFDVPPSVSGSFVCREVRKVGDHWPGSVTPCVLGSGFDGVCLGSVRATES